LIKLVVASYDFMGYGVTGAFAIFYFAKRICEDELVIRDICIPQEKVDVDDL
jgi:hypothetical protein